MTAAPHRPTVIVTRAVDGSMTASGADAPARVVFIDRATPRPNAMAPDGEPAAIWAEPLDTTERTLDADAITRVESAMAAGVSAMHAAAATGTLPPAVLPATPWPIGRSEAREAFDAAIVALAHRFGIAQPGQRPYVRERSAGFWPQIQFESATNAAERVVMMRGYKHDHYITVPTTCMAAFLARAMELLDSAPMRPDLD